MRFKGAWGAQILSKNKRGGKKDDPSSASRKSSEQSRLSQEAGVQLWPLGSTSSQRPQPRTSTGRTHCGHLSNLGDSTHFAAHSSRALPGIKWRCAHVPWTRLSHVGPACERAALRREECTVKRPASGGNPGQSFPTVEHPCLAALPFLCSWFFSHKLGLIIELTSYGKKLSGKIHIRSLTSAYT